MSTTRRYRVGLLAERAWAITGWRWILRFFPIARERQADPTPPDDSVEFYEGTLADGLNDDPGGYDPRPDPRTHPEFWTE